MSEYASGILSTGGLGKSGRTISLGGIQGNSIRVTRKIYLLNSATTYDNVLANNPMRLWALIANTSGTDGILINMIGQLPDDYDTPIRPYGAFQIDWTNPHIGSVSARVAAGATVYVAVHEFEVVV